MVLERSVSGELLTLMLVPPGGSTPIPAGRSYDGRDWESVPPLYFKFNCNVNVNGDVNFGCSIVSGLPSTNASGQNADHYEFKATIPGPLSNEQLASRMLSKATFGPTSPTIAEAASMTPEAWVGAQMALPATSHREHFRHRCNSPLPRADTALFGRKDPCQAGSRWNGRCAVFFICSSFLEEL